jgi:riboflavin biosynthesis pyrimidine reductase
MGSTVDGRIIGENWGKNADKYGDVYEQCHNTFDSQAWMVGRVTMEKDFTEGRQPDLQKLIKPIDRKPFVGDMTATSFAVAIDAKGKLGWDMNNIDGDHVIEVLSESVPDTYLQYLQNIGVSYIFAGKNNLDFTITLEQLHQLFGIKTLMLEGGGRINGSLLNAGLVDELSLLILPIADGTAGTPTTFEAGDKMPKKVAQTLKLLDVQKLQDDVVWLRYTMNANP